MQGIAALLCRGEENAVSLRYLSSITGLSTRTVRVRIKAQRCGVRIAIIAALFFLGLVYILKH